MEGEWLEDWSEQRALRPKKFNAETRPHCRWCSAVIRDRYSLEVYCDKCQEKRHKDSVLRIKRIKRLDLTVDW